MSSHTKKVRRILSCDGGGSRGLITVTFLAALESRLQRERADPTLSLADVFDVFVGNSTGSIIAGCLAMGMSANEIAERVYTDDNMVNIFSRSTWGNIKHRMLPSWAYTASQINSPAYSGLPKRQLIESHAGVRRLCDLTRKLVVPSYDRTRAAPVFWHNFNNHAANASPLLAQIIDASTAAPLYFPGVTVEFDDAYYTKAFYDELPGVRMPLSGDVHVDGALACNNPVLIGYALAEREWPDAQICALSIGTAFGAEPPDTSLNSTSWSVAKLVDALLEGPAQTGSLSAEFMLGDRFLRINSALPTGVPETLDATDAPTLYAFRSLGADWDTIHGDRVVEFINTGSQK